MSSHIPRRLAREVRERAGDVCEYCSLPQDSQEATFHVDHIVPRSRGGATTLDNLALACVTCSLRKAARQRVRDPRTGRLVPLYNPRTDKWTTHFDFTARWRLAGRTPIGRATIKALGMNRAAVIAIRRELVHLRPYPPAVR
jgi:5-methylcytosine-specific restriction endonuclease McrA